MCVRCGVLTSKPQLSGEAAPGGGRGLVSPLGVIGVDAKLGRKERCFHVFLLSLFPRRAMEAPEGLSARKGSLLEPQAVPGESQPLPANAVQITVVKAQDLKSIRSDASFTLVRVEYDGVTLGDSSTIQVLPNGTASYNFTTSFEYSPDGPNFLVDIAQKPVLLTVIEASQKQKKQKEEKVLPLGQAVVDLLPLLQGQCSFTVLAPLYAVPTSPSESLHPEAKCGLEVTVRTEKPLLSVSQLSNGNFLSVTLEAAYSVPDTFVPTGPPQNYMACLQVPAFGEVRMGPGTLSCVLVAAAQVVLLHWGQTARLGLKLAVFFHATICFFFLPSPALISWHLLLLMLKTEVLLFSCLSRRKSLCSSRTAS
uniref:Uncharacterized protein n=1 Tax=Cairina moschata TaxID=8855 RepID=A0A8C3BPI3_CAIMO